MDSPVHDSRSRRGVLTAIGAGLLAGATASVGSAADDHDEDDDYEWGDALPEEEALLAAYSFEDGEYVFETGRSSLEVGDDVRFMTTTDDDGGSRWFYWNAAPYLVSTVAVRCGDRVERFEYDDETNGRVDLADRIEGEVPAIDAVEFGITVRWQVDFGTGDVPEPPRYWPDYLVAALGTSPGGATENPSSYRTLEEVPVEPLDDEFDVDLPEVSLRFEVTGDDPVELHLASFELPNEYGDHDLDEQVRFDSTVREFEPGEHTITVPVPTPDSMSAEDFEDAAASDDPTEGEDGDEGATDEGGESDSASGDAEGDDSADDGEGDDRGTEGTDAESESTDDATEGSAVDDTGADGEADEADTETEETTDAETGDGGSAETGGGSDGATTGGDGGADGTDGGTDEAGDEGRVGAVAADATPGPGIVSALASLGGLGYLLSRRADDAE